MAATAPAAPERGLTTTSVDPEVAAAMTVFDRLDPLKNALGIGDLSVPEMQLFAMVAHRTGLDPFTRQIYAIKRGGKVTHQTGIDGYRSVAERTGQYLGSEEATYEPCTCKAKPEGHPAVARVVVRRAHPSGHVVEQTGVARWHELVPGSGQDSMWLKMPFNQLAKCAEAAGLRKAFPRVLGGVYISEEMAQAGPAENGQLVEAAAKETPRDRLRARREAIAGQVVEVARKAEAPAAPAPTPDVFAADPEPTAATEPTFAERLRHAVQESDATGPATADQKSALGAVFAGYDGPSIVAGLRAAFGLEADDEGRVEVSAAQAHAVLVVADSVGPDQFDAGWAELEKEEQS